MTGERKREPLYVSVLGYLASGFSTFLLTLLLPTIIISPLGYANFGTWAIILQLCISVGYLSFNMQTTTSVYVSRLETLTGSRQDIDSFVAASARVLIAVAFFALVGVLALAVVFDVLFPHLSGSFVSDAQIAVVVAAGSASICIPISSLHGVLAGRGQAWRVGAVMMGTRGVATGLIALAALFTKDLVWMASAYAVGSALLIFTTVWAVGNSTVRLMKSIRPDRASYVAVVRDSAPLAVWSVATFVVVGLHTLIVGRVDSQNLPAFALVASLCALAIGVQGNTVAVFIPLLARRLADGAAYLSGQSQLVVVHRATLAVTTGLMCMLIIASPSILRIWLPTESIQDVSAALLVLMLGTYVRLAFAGVPNYMVAGLLHRKLVWPPVLEAAANLAFSVVLGSKFGVAGVACGTLIGGCLGVGVGLYAVRQEVSSAQTNVRRLLLDAFPYMAAMATAATVAFSILEGLDNA